VTVEILPARRVLTGTATRHTIGRCALAAIVISFFAFSTTTLGGDFGAAYPSAIAIPPKPVPAGRRPMPAHPINPPAVKPDRSATRTPIVDQLYEELMHWAPPGCSSATNYASSRGAC
jgi:hypothetical protein